METTKPEMPKFNLEKLIESLCHPKRCRHCDAEDWRPLDDGFPLPIGRYFVCGNCWRRP